MTKLVATVGPASDKPGVQEQVCFRYLTRYILVCTRWSWYYENEF